MRQYNRDMVGFLPGAIIGTLIALAFIGGLAGLFRVSEKIRCSFDRNEIGPKGEYGQWYWEIYKCSDGTKRRELVAGPRG